METNTILIPLKFYHTKNKNPSNPENIELFYGFIQLKE
jgi:hypothetical protein